MIFDILSNCYLLSLNGILNECTVIYIEPILVYLKTSLKIHSFAILFMR